MVKEEAELNKRAPFATKNASLYKGVKWRASMQSPGDSFAVEAATRSRPEQYR